MTTLFLSFAIYETLILIAVLLFPIWALIDILKSKFEGNTKLIWIMLVVFTNLIGTILYFIIGKNQKIKE